MAYPSQGSSISFAQLNTQLGHSSTAQLTLGNAGNEEFGRTIGLEIAICEFYTDGCPPVPNSYTYPFNVSAIQGDIVGEQVGVYWTAPGSLAFTLASYTVWTKVNSGSWSVNTPSIGTTGTYFSDSTQPGFTIYYRVQAIGTGGEKSPPDVDMDNTGTTYPPTGIVTTQDETPTTI